MHLSKGTYTLWTVPREAGAELIVNKQTGQWGTEYHPSFDLGTAALDTRTVTPPVEKFTISIAPGDARHQSRGGSSASRARLAIPRHR